MAKTIGQLTQTTTLASGDEFVIEQSGLTKRVAASVVRGGLINADIDAAAAIAGSKLADGGITAAKLDGAQTGSAPIYGCRAWVNFDGTSVTNVGGEDRCAISANGNVSKVVRNSTGDYTVHFTTALDDANYAVSLTAATTVALGNPLFQLVTNASGSCRFNVVIRSNGVLDNSSTVTAVFMR
jgi:hypothetical protein